MGEVRTLQNLMIGLRKRQMQERCARGDAWKMTRSVLKLKGKDKATFSSPAEAWCIPAPSLTHPEDQEFVVDSRASMHMLSRTDCYAAGTGHRTSIQKNLLKSCRLSGQCRQARKRRRTLKIWVYSGRYSFWKIDCQFCHSDISARIVTDSNEWIKNQKIRLFKKRQENLMQQRK